MDCYVEAQKRLPSREIELETKDGTFYFFKADILSNQITYSTDKNIPANLVTISGKRAFEIIGMNKRGTKPESLVEEARQVEPKKPIDLLEQESLTRFDRSRKGKNGGENNGGGNGNSGNNNRKKKKKEIRINPEINNPDHAHKVSPDRKVISPNHKAISDGENNPGATSPNAPTIHPDHKERNQPEMKTCSRIKHLS